MTALMRRPVVRAASDAWKDAGVCQTVDPDTFFPEGRGAQLEARTAEAKAVCMVCPVRPECLAWALETRQDFGVWGGLSEDERRSLIRKSQQRLRPLRPTPQWNVIEQSAEQVRAWAADKVKGNEIARRLGVGSDVFYRWRRAQRAEETVVAAKVSA